MIPVAATPTLKRLVELIKEICLNHLMIKDFRFGPLYDMNALRDLVTPYVWLELVESKMSLGNGSKKIGLITFNIYCMDRITKSELNYNEILSDTKFTLETILVNIDQNNQFVPLDISFDPTNDVSLTPVYEETDMNNNGHLATFTLRYPIRMTPCNVPFNEWQGIGYDVTEQTGRVYE